MHVMQQKFQVLLDERNRFILIKLLRHFLHYDSFLLHYSIKAKLKIRAQNILKFIKGSNSEEN